MKKILSVVLSLVLLLSCATPVFAGEAAADPETIKAGESVAISVTIPAGTPALVGAAIQIVYDSEAFVPGAGPTGWFFEASEVEGQANGNWNAADPVAGEDISGNTYSFSFTSKEDATADEYEFVVKFDSENTLDANWAEVEVEGGTATVTIEGEEPVCEHAETEVKDAKEAQIGVPGYTGDKYCVDCGELIEKGTEIPALEDDTTGGGTTGGSTTGGSTTGGSTTGGSTTGGSTTGGSTTGGSTTGGSTTGGSTTGGSTTGGSTTGGSTTGGSTTGGSTTGGSTTGGSTTGGSTTGGSTTGGSTTPGTDVPTTGDPTVITPVGPAPEEDDEPTTFKYIDVDGHWCEGLIYKWTEKGVIEGVGGNKFNPDGLLTRAQAAAIFTRWLDLEATTDISFFTDVKVGDWYYDYVAKCYAAGIVKGKAADQFAPNDYITRAEMFTMLCRALNIDGQTTISKVFTDIDQVPAWAAEYTYALINNGYVSGMTETTLAPLGNLTRAQMVKLMDNLEGLVK